MGGGRFIRMLTGEESPLPVPRHAQCETHDGPIAERGGRGSNKWVAPGYLSGRSLRDQPPRGRNDDGSHNDGQDRCGGTEDGTGRHTPRDGSIW